MEAKSMKTEELIGALVELDKQGKENRALTNAYKAELQARGISSQELRNNTIICDAGILSVTWWGHQGHRGSNNDRGAGYLQYSVLRDQHINRRKA